MVLLLHTVWHLGQFLNNLPTYCVHAVWLVRLCPNEEKFYSENVLNSLASIST